MRGGEVKIKRYISYLFSKKKNIVFKESMFRSRCPVCRTRMEVDMFSPLTLNITDLLAVPCIFMDQGCTIKLQKEMLEEHQKDKCTFRELNCPGCQKKIQACKVPDHLQSCLGLQHPQVEEVTEESSIVHKAATESCDNSNSAEMAELKEKLLRTDVKKSREARDKVVDDIVANSESLVVEGPGNSNSEEMIKFKQRLLDTDNKKSRKEPAVVPPWADITFPDPDERDCNSHLPPKSMKMSSPPKSRKMSPPQPFAISMTNKFDR